MTEPKKRNEETKTPRPASDLPTDEEPSTKPKAAGSDYVFKIKPVNPKNSFDFEDVADK